MSGAPSSRGSRTPGLITGRLSNPKRGPKPARRLSVAASYCSRAEVAVLADIAFKTREDGQDADEATLAYQAARAAYVPHPSMPPLASDMAGEATLGRAWTMGIVDAMRRYADHARIERMAPSIAATQRWTRNLGKAAAAFVAAWEAPIDPLAKSIARADIEAHMPDGGRLCDLAANARRVAWLPHAA